MVAMVFSPFAMKNAAAPAVAASAGGNKNDFRPIGRDGKGWSIWLLPRARVDYT
jgi:hypothetical protein